MLHFLADHGLEPCDPEFSFREWGNDRTLIGQVAFLTPLAQYKIAILKQVTFLSNKVFYRLFPDANLTLTTQWNRFDDEYCW